MSKEEISLDIAISKEEMNKIKDLLTSAPRLKHFAMQLKTGECLDLVEYKDYEILEKENQQLKERIKKAIDFIKKYQKKDEFLELNEWQTRDLLEILKGN